MKPNNLVAFSKTLKIALNSKFYREKLKNISKIETINDFYKLPTTTASELVENSASFLSASLSNVDKIVTLNTSGTTAKPKRIFFTKKELYDTVSFFIYGLAPIIKSGGKTLVMMPYNREFTVGDLIGKALIKLNSTPVNIGFLKDLEECYRLLLGANNIVGTPAQVLALARYTKYKGEKINLDGVLLSADYGSDRLYNEIENAFNCTVLNHYGTTEMGFGGAVECLHNKGLHLRKKDLYVEVLKLDSDKNSSIGEHGEIAFTTLTRTAQPFIRYRTGDYGRFITNSCDCSNDSVLLDRPKGRIDILFSNSAYPNIYQLDKIFLEDSYCIDYIARLKENFIQLDLYVLPNDKKDKQWYLDKYYSHFCYPMKIELYKTEVWPKLYMGKRIIK